MLAFKHSVFQLRHDLGTAWPALKLAFSVDAGVCTQEQDGAGLERLLRDCARPPFALDRLRQRAAALLYHCPKPQSGGNRADLVLSPLELIERITALVPPPRTQRRRYYGVGIQPPRIAPASGQPLWDECDAPNAGGAVQGALIEPHWGESTQAAPDDARDQPTDW